MFRMFEDFEMKDEDAKKETITLYDLKFEKGCQYFENKEEDLEHKEENLIKSQYYKIDDKKLEELEKVFKQVKTKIKLDFQTAEKSKNLSQILFDIKKVGNKNLCIIYENFSKILEIEILDKVLCVEKLDNKDLIFLAFNRNDYELLVYRLKPGQKNESKGYFLIQKIGETIDGYELKYHYKRKNFYGKKEKDKPIEYELFYIKAISKNRFFCISNYGFKMYALNKKNEYELVLLESSEKIDFIYEIDTNNFIFGLSIRRVEGYGFCGNAYTCYYDLFLNKVELIDIDKKKNQSEQEKSNENDLDDFKMKEKLKFSSVSKGMFEFNYSSPLVYDKKINFSDFVSVKNKFFIIMIERSILIFNMETVKEIKRFDIKVNGANFYNIDIKKWDCPENDEFILIVSNNVVLFKLIEENSSEISLNILNHGYFPELCYKNTEKGTIVKSMKKINGQKNKFYTKEYNNIIIY